MALSKTGNRPKVQRFYPGVKLDKRRAKGTRLKAEGKTKTLFTQSLPREIHVNEKRSKFHWGRKDRKEDNKFKKKKDFFDRIYRIYRIDRIREAGED